MDSIRVYPKASSVSFSAGELFPVPQANGCGLCVLRHLIIRTCLPAERAHELEKLASHVTLHVGGLLVCEGEQRRYVFTVQTGALRCTRSLPDGRRLVAGFLMPGDYIGFSGFAEYRHTIEAIADSTLCSVSQQGMRILCDTYQWLEHELMQRACIELDAIRENLMTLARMTPPERLAGFLQDMSQRRQRIGLDPTIIKLPMTRTDIADYLGLTIETVSRSFTRLRDEGFIATPDRQTVQLLDRRKLDRLAAAS